MEVFLNGVQIGSVVQNWNPIRPSFSIHDATGDSVLRIKGPVDLCPNYNLDFEVRSPDGEHKVGIISKKWTGFGHEVFTDSDLFGISFPVDLDVKIKSLLLGACFLIMRILFCK